MTDPIASPGDPLFYLHHTWLDKLWADWQAMDLPHRLTEMGGNNVQDEPNLPPNFPPRPPSIP
jgi:tyrosinase